jgi:DNA-binding NtrC family response regulator
VVGVLGGALALSSTPITGSTFSFTLPLTPGAPAAPQPLPALGTVLVVDDELGFRHFLRALLAGAASRIIEADGVGTALRVLDESVPDLVLLDLRMPDGPGERVLEKVTARQARRAIPVVIITSMTQTGQTASSLAGWPIVSKAELTAATLSSAVNAALQGRSR